MIELQYESKFDGFLVDLRIGPAEELNQAMFGGEGVARISVITPGLVLFALVFSLFVGVFSGYHPANKAVKVSALEAIRNE